MIVVELQMIFIGNQRACTLSSIYTNLKVNLFKKGLKVQYILQYIF